MYEIARLRIALIKMPRPVLRRVEVPLSIHLDDLHLVIQHAMGWENRHPYEFRVGKGVTFGPVDPKSRVKSARQDSSAATLADVCQHLTKRRLTFEYVYDFQDYWVHRVKLQGIGEPEPGRTYPHLLAAVRRCPPEDCGGSWGFRRLMERLNRRKRAYQANPDMDWDEDFEPDRVNVKLIRMHFERIAETVAARKERGYRS